MALLVLFVPGDEPDRLGFVQSSFLGIVSWQFILVSSTPVTGYNTKLDNFMLISMVVVFVAYAWNSIRVGFFDWVTKLHDKFLADGGDTNVTPADVKLFLKSASAAMDLPPSDDKVPSTATPTKGKGRSRVWRMLCLKCGEESMHWVVDTSMGVFLSSVFVVACALLLTSKTSQ